MNDTNNLISEELGKMTQLFNYQRGKVISEQASSVATDVGAISHIITRVVLKTLQINTKQLLVKNLGMIYIVLLDLVMIVKK